MMARSDGFALAEVLVSILLMALCASMLGAVLLQAKASGAGSDERERSAAAEQALFEELGHYVTADPSPLPGCRGPGGRGCPPGEVAEGAFVQWHLPGDDCGGRGSTCWALAEGEHDATALLAAGGEAPPAGASLRYKVTTVLEKGLPLRRIEVALRWPRREP